MENDYFKKLNPEQLKAVTHSDGPLLIVAGAGTGKTTVITQRLSWLIQEKKATGEEILALTFTDKAAGEMEERVDRLLPYGYLDLWISTFHSFAERVLKENALEIGLSYDFKLLNQTEQWLLVRQNLDKFNLNYYRPLGNPTKFIHALIKLFSRAKDETIRPEQYLEYAKELKLNSDSREFVKTIIDEELKKSMSKKEQKELIASEIKKQEEVADAYHVYQQLLLENNALDFGDLINYCLKLFKERPLVLNKYRKQFKYILVDEFQDTNHAQYELIKLLAAPTNNVTVVGDDDQSIFKFRGASISNILEFKKDYKDAQEIFLTKNYRSTQNILDLSYKFIQQNNPYRLEVKLKKDGKKLSKKLKSHSKEQGIIRHLHLPTVEDEVKTVLKQIVDLKNKDKDTTWNDFAILVRANASANLFLYGLDKAEIPYQFVASTGLYSKPIVLDILAYLKLLDNYHESAALHRILSLPVFDLKHRDLVNLNYWSQRKGRSLYLTMQNTATLPNVDEDVRGILKTILDLISKHSKMVKEKKVGEIITAFLEDSGHLQNISKVDSQKTQATLNILNQYYKKVVEFENSVEEPTVKNYLQMIEFQLEAGDEGALQNNLDEGPECLKVMTVHGAKGLEFKYVFVVNLVDRRFPTMQRGDPIQLPEKLIKELLPEGDVHLQEERRLFYVAMTRAKQDLYLTSAEDYGGQKKKKLSRFLTELDELGLNLSDKIKSEGKSLIEQKKETISYEIDQDSLQVIIPAKFSFTQLRAFESCPYQYRFAHVLRVPIRGKAVFSFGKTIHATLQKFFALVQQRSDSGQADLFGDKTASVKNGQLATLDELIEIYRNTWIDDWYTTQSEQDEYKKKGEKALKEFFKSIKDDIPVPIFLERPFNVRVDEYTLKGVIDRVDETDGGVEIIDYKTGKVKGDNLKAEDKEQLLIYQMAGKTLFDKPVKLLSYYYVEGTKKVSFLGTEKELEKLQQKIVKIIKEIKKGEFPPTPSQLCKWCDFRNICEYRAL